MAQESLCWFLHAPPDTGFHGNSMQIYLASTTVVHTLSHFSLPSHPPMKNDSRPGTRLICYTATIDEQHPLGQESSCCNNQSICHPAAVRLPVNRASSFSTSQSWPDDSDLPQLYTLMDSMQYLAATIEIALALLRCTLYWDTLSPNESMSKAVKHFLAPI